MAIMNSDSPLGGFSGRIGNLIVRRYNGRTVLSARPRPSSKPPTDKQLERQARFRRAAAYGRNVCADPNLRQEYERITGKLGVYPIAVRDFLRPPEVTHVIDAEYEGNAGNQIRVYVRDDTKVAAVTVTIRNAAGEAVEHGSATEREYYWAYRAKTSVPPGTTVTIEATARDLAGNKAVLGKEVEL